MDRRLRQQPHIHYDGLTQPDQLAPIRASSLTTWWSVRGTFTPRDTLDASTVDGHAKPRQPLPRDQHERVSRRAGRLGGANATGTTSGPCQIAAHRPLEVDRSLTQLSDRWPSAAGSATRGRRCRLP